jgi:hypothetical protein
MQSCFDGYFDVKEFMIFEPDNPLTEISAKIPIELKLALN